MALKVGSLYVSLTADASKLIRGMGDALKAVEKFSKEIKKASNDIAQVSGVLTAAAGAALSMAKDIDGPTNAAMRDLKTSSQELAVATSQMLLPAVREVTKSVHDLAGYVGGLNPEMKEAIATAAKWAVEIGGVAFVVGKASGLLSSMAGVLRGVVAAIGAIGVGPILAVVAAVAVVAVGIAALHAAWRKNVGGIQQITEKIAVWFADTWGRAIHLVKEGFAGLVTAFGNVAKAAVETQGFIASIGLDSKQMAFVRAATDAAKNQVDAMVKEFLDGDGFGKLVTMAWEAGKDAKDAFLFEWKLISKELASGDIGQAFERFKAMFASSGSSNAFAGVGTMAGGPDWQGAFVSSLAAQPQLGNTWEATHKIAGATDTATLAAMAGPGLWAPVKAALQAVGNGILQAGQTLLGRMGEFGSFVNQIVEGAKAGGPMGAVVAGLTDLLSRTQAFSDLVAFANAGLGRLVQALEPAARALFDAASQLLEPVFQILVPVLDALTPAFEAVGTLLGDITPILMLVAMFIRGLAPVLAFVGQVLKTIFDVLKPVFQVLFEVARIVLTTIIGIIRVVLEIWNGLLEAIASVVDAVVSIFTAGTVLRGGDFIREGKADTTGVDAALTALSGATWDSTGAMAANAVATNDAADAAQRAYESLTNVPSGYKTALARFNADLGLGGVAGGGSPALAGAGGGNVVITGTVNVSGVDDLNSLVKEIKRQARRGAVRGTNNPTGGEPNDPGDPSSGSSSVNSHNGNGDF